MGSVYLLLLAAQVQPAYHPARSCLTALACKHELASFSPLLSFTAYCPTFQTLPIMFSLLLSTSSSRISQGLQCLLPLLFVYITQAAKYLDAPLTERQGGGRRSSHRHIVQGMFVGIVGFEEFQPSVVKQV